MKIKNEEIMIKNGKKVYNFKNLILNEYLYRFAAAQINQKSSNSIYADTLLRYCLLKFDIPFENLNEDTELHNQDFDVCLTFGLQNTEQNISKREIAIKYTYNSKDIVLDYKTGNSENNHISNHYGRKITAIGFNSFFASDAGSEWKVPVCAVLDTTNYNIYLQENQDLVITRNDRIISDARFFSKNKDIKGPVHLAPNGIEIKKQAAIKLRYRINRCRQ